MKLIDIITTDDVFSGEYLYHSPSGLMVLCGHLDEENQTIKVLASGRTLVDHVTRFKKVQLTAEEHRKQATRCKGCGG